jgi:hypothetical protein
LSLDFHEMLRPAPLAQAFQRSNLSVGLQNCRTRSFQVILGGPQTRGCFSLSHCEEGAGLQARAQAESVRGALVILAAVLVVLRPSRVRLVVKDLGLRTFAIGRGQREPQLVDLHAPQLENLL